MKANKSSGTMMMMPAAKGTCCMCATKHEPTLAHNLHSLFYGMRFKMKYDRDPTWADCVAHLSPSQQRAWKDAMARAGQKFSECADPIAEPYAESEGL